MRCVAWSLKKTLNSRRKKTLIFGSLIKRWKYERPVVGSCVVIGRLCAITKATGWLYRHLGHIIMIIITVEVMMSRVSPVIAEEAAWLLRIRSLFSKWILIYAAISWKSTVQNIFPNLFFLIVISDFMKTDCCVSMYELWSITWYMK